MIEYIYSIETEAKMDIVLVIISIVLIILTLLQGGKSDGASGAITGSSKMNIFARTKERGTEVIVSRLTLILGIAFFFAALLVKYYF
jgi:preprotein translocase subunit SecG